MRILLYIFVFFLLTAHAFAQQRLVLGVCPEKSEVFKTEKQIRQLGDYLQQQLKIPVRVRIFTEEKQLHDWLSRYREVDLAFFSQPYFKRQSSAEFFLVQRGFAGFKDAVVMRQGTGDELLKNVQRAVKKLETVPAQKRLLHQWQILPELPPTPTKQPVGLEKAPKTTAQENERKMLSSVYAPISKEKKEKQVLPAKVPKEEAKTISAVPPVAEEDVSGCRGLRGEARAALTYRFEGLLNYEQLSPNSAYGDWFSGNLALYAKVRPNITAFGQLGLFSRTEDGAGQLVSGGAYVDWQPHLSTYSALSLGSGADYLPVWRIDHDFNLPYDPFVWTFGATYIGYEGSQSDWILSAGLTWYHERWVAAYRLFRNASEPGSVASHSHVISLGYGEEGCHWTFLNAIIGAQAYQIASLAEPEEVRQDAIEFGLKHRHWMGPAWGLIGQIGYMELEEGYDKYSVGVGFFKEF